MIERSRSRQNCNWPSSNLSADGCSDALRCQSLFNSGMPSSTVPLSSCGALAKSFPVRDSSHSSGSSPSVKKATSSPAIMTRPPAKRERSDSRHSFALPGRPAWAQQTAAATERVGSSRTAPSWTTPWDDSLSRESINAAASGRPRSRYQRPNNSVASPPASVCKYRRETSARPAASCLAAAPCRRARAFAPYCSSYRSRPPRGI